MNRTIYLLLVISSSLIMNSCSSDDDSSTAQEKENFIKVGDITNKLVSGAAYDFGEHYSEKVYNIDLILLNSEINIDSNENKGLGVYFEIFSSIPNKIAPGTYQYRQSKSILSFDGSYIEKTDKKNSETAIVSGTITVVKSEKDYYELTFNCVDKLDRKITGRYYGQMSYVSEIEL